MQSSREANSPNEYLHNSLHVTTYKKDIYIRMNIEHIIKRSILYKYGYTFIYIHLYKIFIIVEFVFRATTSKHNSWIYKNFTRIAFGQSELKNVFKFIFISLYIIVVYYVVCVVPCHLIFAIPFHNLYILTTYVLHIQQLYIYTQPDLYSTQHWPQEYCQESTTHSLAKRVGFLYNCALSAENVPYTQHRFHAET